MLCGGSEQERCLKKKHCRSVCGCESTLLAGAQTHQQLSHCFEIGPTTVIIFARGRAFCALLPASNVVE